MEVTVPLWMPADPPTCLVVGQSPGRTEAQKGRPFVGVDGLQLRTWLRSVGIDSDAALAWDNVHQIFNGNPTYKPTTKESKAGYTRVALWLTEHPEVKTVLLVGGVAAHMVFKGGITKINGRREVRDGVTYIAILHPGYVRNADIHGSRGAALAAEAEVLMVLRQMAAVLGGDETAGVSLPDGLYVSEQCRDDPLRVDTRLHLLREAYDFSRGGVDYPQRPL
jgi:uracil-DNA glycosylase family 4